MMMMSISMSVSMSVSVSVSIIAMMIVNRLTDIDNKLMNMWKDDF